MLVPFAAGGTVDIVARLVGAKLAEALGQPFVVENRGGAAGTIATALVAKSPGDGYTLMTMHQGLAFNAALYSNLPYDTLQDLAPIAYLGATPNVLVVTDSLPVRTLHEFLDYARRNPGRVAYGSGGVGSAGHLSVERSPALAELPTIAEAGVPGYEYMPWYGLFGPAALPKALADRLYEATLKSLAAPDVRERLAQQGLEYRETTREQFAEMVRADVAKWGKFIRDAGVRAE
jgi:tripartite-type tricarboxylate transporter receptor subunit TctC